MFSNHCQVTLCLVANVKSSSRDRACMMLYIVQLSATYAQMHKASQRPELGIRHYMTALAYHDKYI